MMRRRAALRAFSVAFAPLAVACAAPAPRAAVPVRGSASAPFNGGVLNQPVLIPDLTLQRAGGGQFTTTADLHGRWSLVFFGYTTCPDVCPLTLAYVNQVREKLGARAPEAYFVTVDPARDTPARLTQYLANFKTGITGLTGSDEQLAAARAAFGVVAERREAPESGSGYFMDHTALVYLLDPQGQIQLVYPHGMKPEDITADLDRLLPA